jgi:hypothetical protein
MCLLHVCASAEPGLKQTDGQTMDDHLRIAGADPKSWGSPSKVYPTSSAATSLTSDACHLLRSCCGLLVSDANRMPCP